MLCPVCGSENIVRNGTVRNGKTEVMCKDCGRQSVENPENKNISQEKKDITDRLLPEKIPPAGIARAAGVSERRLQIYVNNKYDNIERKIITEQKEKGRLTIECDEIWSFVNNKDNKVWIWPAKDIDSKKIVGFHAGNRDGKGAQGLWIPCPVFTGNVLYIIPIFGLLMKEFFRRSVIAPQEKKAEKQIISKASTVR